MLRAKRPAQARSDPANCERGSSRLDRCIAETQHAVSRSFTAALDRVPDRSLRLIVADCLRLKRLYDRALIARVTCEAVGGRWRNHVNAFAALDIADCAVLAIDDIIDESSRRLGRETLHEKWGMKQAILAAEVVKSLATEMIAEDNAGTRVSRTLAAFEQTYREVQLGQHLDIVYEQLRCDQVTDAMCVQMVQLTTGAQIAGCCAIGATLGGGRKEVIEAAKQFGLYTGTVFQIRDDLIDYYNHERVIGKVPFSDFARGKKRLPLLLAWKTGSAQDRRKLQNLPMRNGALGLADKRWLAALVAKAEVVAVIRRIAGDLSRRARECLEKLPGTKHRRLLDDILAIGGDI